MTTAIGTDSRKRARRGPGRRTAIALFLLPALVLYAVFVLFPIVQAVHYSFFKWNGLTPLTDFVGLANYQRALADPVFQGAVQHNVLVIVLSLIVQIPFALGLALMLSRRFRGRRSCGSCSSPRMSSRRSSPVSSGASSCSRADWPMGCSTRSAWALSTSRGSRTRARSCWRCSSSSRGSTSAST